jgi:hypothetical protein
MITPRQQESCSAASCLTVQSLEYGNLASWQTVRLLAKSGDAESALTEVFELLSTAPLSPHDYELARKRLANARSYANRDERGASCYELFQLASAVSRQVKKNRHTPRTRST